MPGGSPAGTILGLFAFCIVFNDAGPKASPSIRLADLHQPPTLRQPRDGIKAKFIDDLAILRSVQ
jgi:hypothetical protein